MNINDTQLVVPFDDPPIPSWPFWLALALGGVVLFLVFSWIGCK